ncbi:hypothetical protein [Propionivibrio sp.]|uniref:hypothetical protein n=1 Tax=Propionivibrio sp. TaxID=2212460 RepID=UPI0025CB7C30|nr:hypothetical protein [Propionivibrio sp.]MBK7355918.1 hypothetical protein [Propionivibrio sp.]MBK8400423.1 hypothetical protein [Propionivibrio sp.]MBK8743893.1 hypothetical protein [Propionivibrio sp.]MBK8895329.1 hypothetical protein [Propionivibrio sp.]
MQKATRKVAAALTAVQFYLQQEEEEAASVQVQPVSTGRNMTNEPSQWGHSGRVEMMEGRRLIQLRVFSNAR